MNWQRELIAYQIYPRSFNDSNGDGIGDINGVIEKLDYLKDLGIDLIWISPIYKSPNDDNGYDISDYKDILKEFGTMDDFDNLLREVHKRGMRLIMDLVINHTSDEHPWFIEAKSSKDSEKRDWYIWRKGKKATDKELSLEPNNWASIFGGSAWEYDSKSDEYYLHLFSKKMPDLNWENENLRDALYEMINWWLDKGIDGFRVDAISHIKKFDYDDMPNPENLKYVQSFDKHMKQPGIDVLLQDLKENTFDKYDTFTIAEASGVGIEDLEEWAGNEKGKFSMIFQFEHMQLWKTENDEKANLVNFKRILSGWQDAIYKDGWIALFLENHDLTRSVSKLGDDKKYWKESAKALALMYFMQMGTPFIYQGQEIGMTNADHESIEDFDDVATLHNYKEKVACGMSEEESLRVIKATTRDNSRTPMQWNNEENGGFTSGAPWMKVNRNHKEINVEDELKDEDSILNFYKRMIQIRKGNNTLIYGQYNIILEEHDKIYAYTRSLDNEKYIIITNISKENVEYNYSEENLKHKSLILSNYRVEEHADMTKFVLRPYEARLYKLC
ncbi:glycoside hydrolase family 13 protein [Clostridium chromiireducens]|uniref:Alpha-amylase n=1 Tax=Clostridium chromiireducens TaxID=225345 RepID=A0A1V4IXD6_9CLOT|nr:alpha-glucosidase [Clostridium chromiireducens]OPJ64701.1 oligo-1,6-glucosidase [Clostridium chromiireducens]RII35995.1 alpha-glucosidase [Clostridium chromiireducens]